MVKIKIKYKYIKRYKYNNC